MGLPSDQLRPASASIVAVLFENSHTGLKRDVFWRVEIEFEPMQYRDFNLHCNVQCEWLRLGLRDWRDLNGVRVQGGPHEIESSFYTVEHDLAIWSELAFTTVGGTRFRVEYAGLIDFRGLDESDADPRLPVRAQLEASFEGILIPPAFIRSEDDPCSQAAAMLVPFVDLKRFGTPCLTSSTVGVIVPSLVGVLVPPVD